MTTRMGAGARLARLLAILAWLAQERSTSLVAVAQRFGMQVDDVVHELELASCCGTPPFSPDTLLDLYVDGDRVHAAFPAKLAAPRRLTAQEGLALVLAARALLLVPGSDPEGCLASAAAKIEEVLGGPLGGDLAVHIAAPPLLDEVRRAAGDGAEIEMTYYSASRDELTRRRVSPLCVQALDGAWYLDGWCALAGGWRRFRVDRIHELARTGAPANARARPGAPGATTDGGAPGAAFLPGPGTLLATVRMPPGGRWILDSIPVISLTERKGGWCDVRIAVGGRAWLERLLLRAGPGAVVVDPPGLANASGEAARRVLVRYRCGSA